MDLIKENRFHRPISECSDGELLYSIREKWNDAHQSLKELEARGWSRDYIDAYVDGGHAGLAAFIEARHGGK